MPKLTTKPLIQPSILAKILEAFFFSISVLDIFGPVRNIINWPTYFLDILGLIRKPYVLYKLKNGLSIKTRAKTIDKFVLLETNIHKDYNPKGFEIKSDDTVIDIGAQIGTFCLYAANIAKSGKVFAFEPELTNYKLLSENVEENKFTNVILSDKAIGSTSGEKSLFLANNNEGGHSLIFKNDNAVEQKVEISTLEDVIAKEKIKRINFLKIDAEGAEYDIIIHLSNDIFGIIEKIALEFHDLDSHNNGTTLSDFLQKKGYKVQIKKLSGASRGLIYAHKNRRFS